ncbi:hypothetical protein [Reichenbachiella versicolor]|uniref:hypothetical protein n=1 Tax=Reichenbachiella versicolor TaxID=1821036 RepID=UPI000D6E81BD|nr:hypothetical protein [Reichenbachiella versicolor]
MNLRIINNSTTVFVQCTGTESATPINGLNIPANVPNAANVAEVELVPDELDNINGTIGLQQPEQSVQLETSLEGDTVIVRREGANNVLVPRNGNIQINWSSGITNITAY